MKCIKSITTLLLALALIFCLVAPVMAEYTPNNSAYRQVALANAPTIPAGGKVYLSIVSNEVNGAHIGRYDLEINIETAGVYYVSKILNMAHTQHSELSFFSAPNTDLTDSSQRLYGVKDTDVSTTQVFAPSYPEYDKLGWMFRIDNKFPLLNSANWPSGYDEDTLGPIGADISQAYVTNGQHIFFYFACAKDVSTTHYVKFSNFAHTSGTTSIAFQLFDCYCWYDTAANDYYWHIEPYDEEYSPSPNNLTVTLNGSPVTAYYYSGCYHIFSSGILNGQKNTLVLAPKYYSTPVTSDYSPYASYIVPEYTETGCTFIG